ncbi:protein E6 [Vigna radiata var. radiata]|uniref:Protein E6 n=1 Tax=Vigna radiata var. radiata TaxID=3916 RepID=A0A1S3VHK4_VIGRR|nr:protein E6 [Vigna radiata var. radiata]
MAHSSNYISFLLFTTLFLALQISARESNFFSKVSHFDNNNVKETELPNKEAPEVSKVDQQPAFVPETENSYGLYGHDESNQVPSTTTTKNADSYTTPTSYHPYKTEFQNNKYFNNDAYNNRFAETNNNKNSYGGDQDELSDTKYAEQGYNNNYQNNNQQQYYNNDAASYKSYGNNQKYYNNEAASYKSYDNNNNQKYYYNDAASQKYKNSNNNYNGNANRYIGEKQGMSDTRFLEGGRYFHDIYAEENHPTNYDDSSRGVNNNNWYNNRGGNYNGYQNEAEFEDEHENFEP